MDHQSDKDTSRPEVNIPRIEIPFLQTPTVKMIMIGFLVLFLLIPLQFVKDLISERSQRKNDVIKEVSEKWGSSVYFYGPILKVPYTEANSTTLQYTYIFPEKLENQTTVETKPLNRNIYDATVFTAEMNFKGSYVKPDFDIQNIPAGNIHWDKTTILIQTTNLKSIKDQVDITFGGKPYTFEPTYNNNGGFVGLETLETAPIDMIAASFPKSFQFKVKYDGSQMIRLVPIGKTTEMSMKSNWHSPGFTGNFLPNDKTKVISDDGFQAKWKVLHINRAFSQQYFNNLPDLSRYAFGVNFVVPVDEYQKNERVSKYGFLVIGLTFLTFFLIQSISKIRIHIFQYFMIGIALVLFYTLLIAITEHSSFRLAYILSGIGVVLMISLYSFSILKNPKFPLLIGTSLSALYLFIYIIIQMENYALLVGSIGLFIILGLVMYLSRKIDWNSN